MITCYADPRKSYSVRVAAAFAAGCGGEVALDFKLREGVAVIVGMAEPQRALMRAAADWYHVDHGYFGRGAYYRVSHQALWTDGHGPPAHEKLERFGVRFSGRVNGGPELLVCTQTPGAYAFERSTQDRWLADTVRALRAVSNRHPVIRHKPIGHLRSQPPVHELFPFVHALVCHSSCAALEALAHGVPVVVTSTFPACLLATELDKVETPFLPTVDARRDLFARIAAQQWNVDEMASGECWGQLHGDR